MCAGVNESTMELSHDTLPGYVEGIAALPVEINAVLLGLDSKV